MRITNKIMQRNNLSNINTNKIYQDRLSNQMSTQKKINRPSDDPVVAIRALRLRSSVTEVTQYYSKNIPDANSWLDVTEGALKNLADIVTNMIAQCTKGASGHLTAENRQIILEQLKALSAEVYCTGDADYAGRYVFTGYRTDTSLSFREAESDHPYEITEQLDSSAISSMTHVNTGALTDWNITNFKTNAYFGDENALPEQDNNNNPVNTGTKLSEIAGLEGLASQSGDFTLTVDGSTITVSVDGNTTIGDVLSQMQTGGLDASFNEATGAFTLNGIKETLSAAGGGSPLGSAVLGKLGLSQASTAKLTETAVQGTDEESVAASEVHRIRLAYNACTEDVTPTISFNKTDNGVYQTTWGADVITTMHDYEDPYAYTAENADAVVYVPETGELLLGTNRYGALMATKDDVSTATVNEAEIAVTYQKKDWLKGDLRPEHYFYCKENPGQNDELVYNSSYYYDSNPAKQEIEYDVGFNQTIRVNSTADECFQHGIGREADDLVASLEEVLNLEKVKKGIEDAMKTATETDTAILQDQLDAVNKALTFSEDKCQKLFERGITAFQGYLDDTNLCLTNCGTRSSKLELIENRMQNQKTTFETLRSENEDIDITEVAIQLSSAELTYEAALMATGKVMQTTLLNFI